MTITIARDETGDFAIDTNRRPLFTNGVNALVSIIKGQLQTVKNENRYLTTSGLPYFDAAFNGVTDLVRIEEAIRQTVLSNTEVVKVVSIDINQANDKLTYTVQLKTIYSPDTITINV